MLFIILIVGVNAQSADISNNVKADSTQSNKSISGKNPTIAGTLSFVLPGGGQFYNDKYFKSGIVIAADAYFVRMAVFNENQRQEKRKKMLEAVTDADKEFFRGRMNEYYESRQSNYWWIGITTFLSIADAYVDAHLYNFQLKKKEVELRFSESKLVLTYKF